MNTKHYLDLKIPLGLILTLYGLILTIYGLTTPIQMYEKSANINLNILFGSLVLILGILFLSLSLFKFSKKST